MTSVKVICPEHGLIKTIEMDCFWLGRPPFPEIDNAHCPKCGKQTIIERPTISEHSVYWSSERAKNDRYR